MKNKLIGLHRYRRNIAVLGCVLLASVMLTSYIKNSSQLTCEVGPNLVFPMKKALLNCQLVG